MEIARAKTPVHLPVVLSRGEAAAVLGRLGGVSWLRASLMYGSGLRVLESCRLQVKEPWVFFARKIFRMGSERPETSLLAFSRRRAPIGGARRATGGV